MAKRHDFLDEQWDQSDEAPAPRRSGPRPPAPRRRPAAGCAFVACLVLILAVVYFVLAHPRETTPTRVQVNDPTAEQTTEAQSSDGGSSSPSAEPSLPPADEDMEQVITRWAERSSAKDQSWQKEVSGQVAPDTARRLAVLPCLPTDDAPLHVVSLSPNADPTQDDETWSGNYTLIVKGKKHGKSLVTVRPSATWDQSSHTWVLTTMDCPESGGDE